MAAMACPAAPLQAHVSITTVQIAAAISGAGMQISADQVNLLSDVVATTPLPVLVVESMQPWGDRRMKVRLSCAASEHCLPFIVMVRLGQQGGSQPAIAAASAEVLRAGTDSKSYVVRAGAPATLLLDGGHVHIRIAVVCLENGAAGQTIRVASKDRRQTYMAKVIDQSVLRASL
jgi:hypothetical protein